MTTATRTLHLRRAARGTLSTHEVQVIAGIARGHTAHTIASHLNTSTDTVKNTMHNVKRRIGMRSNAALISYAYTTGALTHLPPEPRPDITLTGRELQVLQGMARGQTNDAIGRELFLSVETIKCHSAGLFRKLQSVSREHAVALGYQHGLLIIVQRDAR